MNITSVKYQKYMDKTSDVVKATIDGEEMFVPMDEGNRHYVAILEWAEKDGNTIEEAG